MWNTKLTDEEVKARTDVTIKMANAAQESATIVSDQLTAIWNNFYDGSQSLEYYADILTKLGAATASSTDEIAEGLEKFAAIGDTIGLSYEYATSALTTIMSNTRQSADVVGTALKTIFARMQDLEQGNTLDDGTTLGTYAQALQKVGIQVLDTNGNLIKMDKILDQMGEKWQTLTEAQQVALAQQVAGIRQYNQITALMSNWDNGDADSMQANLEYTRTATGELQNQADIYAESWAAAQDRVAASAEKVYSSLIDEDFFIDLLDIGSEFLDLIANLIDGLGGIKGVLATISAYVLTIGRTQVIKELERISGASQKKKQQEIIDTKNQANQALQTVVSDPNATKENQMLAQTQSNIATLQMKIFEKSKLLTEEQESQLKTQIESYETLGKTVQKRAKELDLAERELKVYDQTRNIMASVEKSRVKALQDQVRSGNIPDNILALINQYEDRYENVMAAPNSGSVLQPGDITMLTAGPIDMQTLINEGWSQQEAIDMVNEYNASLNRLLQTLTNIHAAIGNDKDAQKQWEAEYKSTTTAVQKMIRALSQEEDNIELLKKAYAELQKNQGAFTIFNNTFANADQEHPENNWTWDEALTALENSGWEGKAAHAIKRKILNAIQSAFEQLQAVTPDDFNLIDNVVEHTLELDDRQKNLNELFGEFASQIDQLQPRLIGWQEALVGTASSLSTISMIANSIKGLIDTFNNDDLSFLEQFSTFMTTIGMTLPMIINLFKAENVQSLLATSNLIKQAAGYQAYSKEAIAAATSTGVFNIAVAKMLLPLIALTAAIVGVIGVAKLLINWWNKDADAAKNAAAIADEAAESFNKASSSWESLKSSIEDYQEMQIGLKNLTVGTEEWSDAIKEANAQVLEMINNYPELAKYFKNTNGTYTFTDLDTVEELYEKRVREAQSAKLLTAQSALEAKNINIQTQALRNNSVADTREDFSMNDLVAGVGSSAFLAIVSAAAVAAGAATAPVTIPALIAAGVIGTGGHALTANYNEGKEDEAGYEIIKSWSKEQRTLMSAEDGEEFKSALVNSGKVSADVAQKLYDNREAIFDNIDAIKQNTEAIHAYNLANANALNLDNEFYKNLTSDDQDLADQIIAKRATDDEESDGFNKFVERYQDPYGFKWIGEDFTRDWKEDYLKALYGDQANNYRIKGLFNKKVQQLNDDGQWEDVGSGTIDYDSALRVIYHHNNNLMRKSDEDKLNEIEQIRTNLYSTIVNGQQKSVISNKDSDIVNQLLSDLISGKEEISLIEFSPEQEKQIEEALNNKVFGEYSDQVQAATESYRSDKYWDNQAQNYIAQTEEILSQGATDLGVSKNTLESYAISLMKTDKALKNLKGDEKEQQATMAKASKLYAEAVVHQYKLAQGLDNTREIYKKYADYLHKGNEESLDYNEGIGKIADSLSTAFERDVGADLVIEKLETVKKMLNGDGEALKDFKRALNEDYVMNLHLGDTDELNTALLTALDELQTQALSPDNTITTEISVNNDKAIEALNTALITGQTTIDDIQKMFNDADLSMPEYHVAYLDGPGSDSEVTTTTEIFRQKFTFTSNVHTNTKQAVPYFGDEAPKVSYEKDPNTGVSSMKIENAGSGSLDTNALAGVGDLDKITQYDGPNSGKSKASKIDLTKESEIVDRYKEQDDILDDIEDSLNRISKAADRAFGTNRLIQLKKEQETLLKQKKAYEDKLAVAQKYYESDKKSFLEQTKAYGYNFTIDDAGNISNYTEQMTKLYNELHNAEVKMNSFSSKDAQDKYKESTYDPIKKKVDKIKDLISQYDDTKELIEDLQNSIKEAFYAWQDANYEELQYKLELKLDIDDAKLKELEFDLKLYGDNFYKRVESAIAMMDKMPSYEDKLGNYWGNVGELDAKFAANKISQADYIDGLKEARDGIYEQLEALVDLDNEMMHYYEDTLSAATEELGDYTDHMEHLTSVFDHYLSLMDILGKQKDYDSMGDFLTGKADTLRDRLGVAKEYYQVLEDQRVKAEQALASASNDEERELLKENLDAIIDEVDAAEEEVLSLTEEWASAMKEVIENEMASIADTLEKALTNGLGFEELMDNFDKLNTRQEEYLTKTNQIYETNKLMRTASKALDETDNKVAKQKLKNFIEETQSLQENTKLSEYELEIQQAKYDLLLAEIALEEAQNAKSTVRLSRDNEGNFGYVYTADQDAVDDAEQGLDDAKNRLYNLSLEGQQDYTDKYLQAQQEMYNALTELQQQYLDGDIATEEEYERRKEEILYHYYNPDDGVLTTYSNLYNVAVRTDADATADYWAKDYGNMTQNTADWYEAVNEYLIRIEEQTNTWKEVSETANDDVQGALEDSRQATEDLTDESEELKKMILKEVMPAIEDEINDVREQTEAYADQRQELMNLISTYRQYISTINSKISSASSSSSGGVDYSYKMAQAFRAGDSELYENLKSSRADKLASGDFSSVDNNRLQGVFEAASGTGSKADKANELIDKVLSGDEKFTKDTLDKYGLKTGGYTGAWGPEGKLAFLHEKELVLNQDDTENLLTAVSFIRDLVSVIDSQASLASLFNLSSAGVASSNSTLEQSVTIHAEFPNATNHSEIEEAFENLVNKASQYANRK